MGEITTIRQAIETRLETISGLEVYDFEPDVPTVTPLATIKLVSIVPNESYGDVAVADRTYRWIITVRIQGSIAEVMWDSMDEYLDLSGSNSIFAAIYGDDTLGSTVDQAILPAGEEFEITDQEIRTDSWFYRTEFPLETWKSGS